MFNVYPNDDARKVLSGELTIDPSYPVIVGYIRTGREDSMSPTTPDEQRESIISCCRNRFEDAHLFLVEDIGCSGVAPYSKGDESGVGNIRDGLGIIMRLVENSLADYICVIGISRISRSSSQFFAIHEILERHGVQILFARTNELLGLLRGVLI